MAMERAVLEEEAVVLMLLLPAEAGAKAEVDAAIRARRTATKTDLILWYSVCVNYYNADNLKCMCELDLHWYGRFDALVGMH